MADLRERKKAQNRDRIAEVGRRLFAERGFERVTVAQIAAEAGVSTKTVFNYYPTKESIFFGDEPPAGEALLAAVRERAVGESVFSAVRRTVASLPAGSPAIGAGSRPADGARLLRAIRERAPGESIYEVISRHSADAPTVGGPAIGLPASGRPVFGWPVFGWPAFAVDPGQAAVYAGSPTLRAHVREAFARQEERLARDIAADGGAAPGDPVPAVVAAALLAPVRALLAERVRLAAHPTDELAHDPPKVAEVACAQVEAADRAYAILAPSLATYAPRPSPASPPPAMLADQEPSG